MNAMELSMKRRDHPVLPPFSQLPLSADNPPYSAWGLWGKDDELGRLNLQTLDVTLAAKEEIITGEVISLNLPLNVPLRPMNPLRKALSHNIIVKPNANDDEIIMNTQASTHWDGLRHYPYQEGHRFYNHTVQDDISGDEKSNRIGVQNIASHPIATRGILLDYARWAEAHNVAYSPFESHAIPVTVLKEIAEEKGITFRQGDVLLVRSGFTKAYLQCSEAEMLALGNRHSTERKFVGVEGTIDSAQWHWECGFQAVAGDTNAYEVWPPTNDLTKGKVVLHELFLSGWGMPIGEQFYLEKLAERCQEQGRWTFFLSSQPLHLDAGIASPANVMAIF